MRLVIIIFFVLCTVAFPTRATLADTTRPFELGSFEKILKQHKGKPLIVNFWSMRCPPCMAEMPVWLAALKKHPELGFVLVSTDSPENEKQIQRILDRYGLGDIDSWVFADPFIERLRYDIDKKWRGELPRTYFFTKDGERTAHSGMVEAAALEVWIMSGSYP